MRGFQTSSGSVYYVDGINKLVSGGILGNSLVPFQSLSAITGCNATIVLVTGQIINTSVVVSYI